MRAESSGARFPGMTRQPTNFYDRSCCLRAQPSAGPAAPGQLRPVSPGALQATAYANQSRPWRARSYLHANGVDAQSCLELGTEQHAVPVLSSARGSLLYSGRIDVSIVLFFNTKFCVDTQNFSTNGIISFVPF